MQEIEFLEQNNWIKKNVIFCVLTFLWSEVVLSQWKLDPLIHTQVLKGIDLILRQQYNQADSLYRVLAQQFPDHPVGYLYQAAVMQAYAIDFDNPIPRSKFDSLLSLGMKTARKLSSPWREYFLGTAEGHDAYERAERGDWFGGVGTGIASASHFEKVIENDSTFYDAYIGLGTYYYWRSRKTALIHWLPFVSDDRELGAKMLIIGANRSEYNRFAAISSLISIYTDAGDYEHAEEWSRRGLQFYPDNRVFWWGLATALDRNKHTDDAISAYQNLLRCLEHSNAPHPYGEIVCRLNLSKLKMTKGDSSDVSLHLKKILTYEKEVFPENLTERVKAKFLSARALLSDIERIGH